LLGDWLENDPREVNWLKIRAGWHGQILDGMLIRVSSVDHDIRDALVRAIDPRYRSRVGGA